MAHQRWSVLAEFTGVSVLAGSSITTRVRRDLRRPVFDGSAHVWDILAGAGGARAVVAESVLVKQQLLILNRSRSRAPHLHFTERMVASVCALLMHPSRLARSAIVLKPSTLLSLHRALTKRKCRRLFSPQIRKKPGPKGPSQDVMAAVVDMKQRNPTWGCPRIAQQIALAFGIPINKDVVRRILAARYQPKPDAAGRFVRELARRAGLRRHHETKS